MNSPAKHPNNAMHYPSKAPEQENIDRQSTISQQSTRISVQQNVPERLNRIKQTAACDIHMCKRITVGDTFLLFGNSR